MACSKDRDCLALLIRSRDKYVLVLRDLLMRQSCAEASEGLVTGSAAATCHQQLATLGCSVAAPAVHLGSFLSAESADARNYVSLCSETGYLEVEIEDNPATAHGRERLSGN